jgi:segregation and condensation protein A
MSNAYTTTDAYQVRLPVFEGPLDLLLHLIEREKLDISTVSLAQVTDQFLASIHAIDDLQPALLADFLAMAARLVWLKSRLLLPRPAKVAEVEEEDPGEALARQLREYKRFKEAAKSLQQMAEAGNRAFVRVAPAPEFERQLRGCDVTLAEFLVAIGRALASKPPAAPAASMVTPFKLTIHDQIHLIGHLTSGGRPVTFRALLGQVRNRVEAIVTLLAVLELLKRRQIVVEQNVLFGDIVITPAAGVEIEEQENGDGEDGAAEM